ncbi:kinase-like domain-containing protein [Radiomyces spectabilis]|uniref:kinase-like domain-containing protein n=1 Tax=Radiomyces spectabilis TaxID=64574 RepID=UPI00221F6E64|nr:kinase-like domain-containing protein [Radiomyces spectabilis]KAI8380894.1 kinase-like domain-containing protein [Radiomyces spectabilis]
MVDKVIDDFQLLEELGRGSYGCLYLGQSLTDNTYVAIKVLTKSGLDQQQLQLQQLEIHLQSSLKHPNLLALHRVIQDQKHIYMVMELCDQGDLFDFVIRDQANNDVRDERLVKTCFLQILDAVAHMHAQNVYHRDLKLENVLLRSEDDDNDGGNFICKVADFGLATRDRYSLEFGCGSTTYLAPEHFEDDQSCILRPEDGEFIPYDAAASDAWSLGILLIAFLFGRNPWQEATSVDHVYLEFSRNPTILKHQLFPSLSWPCFHFLKSVLSIHAADRPTVAEMKQQFLSLDQLLVGDNNLVNDNDDDAMDIPDIVCKASKASYDSAVFSAGQSSISWSDMLDDDPLDESWQVEYDLMTSSSSSIQDHDHDDTDVFIHRQEKESWWL